MSSELTAKQRYQREYYAKNKEKICADKRESYAKGKSAKRNPATGGKRKPKGRLTPTPPARATSPVKKVDKMPTKPRHTIEAHREAAELGITVEELMGL